MKCLVTKLGESIDNPNLENFYTYKYLDTIKSKFSKSLTESEITSLKSFITTLVNAGILSEVQYMALPMFASNPSEAIQNVLLESQVLPSFNNVELDGKYLTFNADGNVDLSQYLISPIVGKMFFASCIASTDYAGIEGKNELYAKFTSYDSVLSVINMKSSSSTKNTLSIFANSEYAAGSFSEENSNTPCCVFSVDGISGELNYFGWKTSEGDYVAQNKNVGSINGIDRFVMNGAGTSYFAQTHIKSRIIIVGNKVLTLDEITVIRRALLDFVKSL